MAQAEFCKTRDLPCVLFTKEIDPQLTPWYSDQPGATFPYAPLSTPRQAYDINEKSDLFPFRTKQGEYWTSIDAKQLPCKLIVIIFDSFHESSLILEKFQIMSTQGRLWTSWFSTQ